VIKIQKIQDLVDNHLQLLHQNLFHQKTSRVQKQHLDNSPDCKIYKEQLFQINAYNYLQLHKIVYKAKYLAHLLVHQEKHKASKLLFYLDVPKDYLKVLDD